MSAKLKDIIEHQRYLATLNGGYIESESQTDTEYIINAHTNLEQTQDGGWSYDIVINKKTGRVQKN